GGSSSSSSLLIRSKNPRRCQAENPLKLLSEFAGPALFLAHKAIRKERIFLQDDLRNEFMEILDLVSKAWVQRLVEHQRSSQQSSLTGISEFYEKGPKGVDKLATMVRSRLLRSDSHSK
ncbi:hypothetical protein, partial [Bradyrhizobium sp. Mp27]|uniref:hypothetical protein n=1 Tax=Bradyrhizobium sp. Mp27 TaxID=3042157 RepID=UPI00248CC980